MSVLEYVVVALLVAGSIAFSAWRLAPASLRLRILDLLPPSRPGAGLIGRLRRAALAEISSGCHACSQTRKAGALRR
jgi:hypothetical protein